MPAFRTIISSRSGRFMTLTMSISAPCRSRIWSLICVFCTRFLDDTAITYYVHITHMEMAMTEGFAADVLICGAGAAGLTLAIDLARRGVSFRLIEKMDGAFRGSRGKGIQPRTQEIFEDLGIVDRVVAVGGLYPPQREYRDDGSHVESEVIAHEDATPAEPYHIALMVPQFLTEGMMRERLIELGHRVAYGCELVRFEQDEAGVTTRLVGKAGEEVVRVRYLVGADGGHSFVRHGLDIGFPGKTLGVRAVVADVVLTGLGRDAWHRFSEGSMQRQMSLSHSPEPSCSSSRHRFRSRATSISLPRGSPEW
jgi:2-polyprenyl-6-methoxyphenol hydroxylase-like FAD-dependent oxidoreductase